jgi:protein TIF31
MSNPDMPDADTEVKVEAERQAEDEYKASLTRAIYSNFKFALNPDVYSGQVPGTEDEREEIANDEADVRAACEYLTSTVIPKLVQQLKDGDVGFPLDGESLSTLLHKRGINIRYLGVIAALSSDEHPRVQALHKLSVQEMICRGFKHVASKYLRHLAAPLASACMSHLLNCFLGSRLHSQPIPEYDESLKVLYTDSDFAFEGVTVDSLRMEVVEQVHLRYRHEVSCDLAPIGREMQLLREISLKLGLQLLAKNYIFAQEQVVVIGDENGELHPSQSISPPPTAGKKKKKAKDKTSSPRGDSPFQKASLTFHPEDIVNFVPVVKDASPKVGTGSLCPRNELD